ncbi:hypothetical protein DB30_07177 [Enhygromyxa salina]|uniref:Uncharacterized protein n=1 Tax=Enhygromyxa salina TaxID=215803 RepID=A0A0C2D6N8_9BACT|nr:hypothetical protein DB30_07177 [Enhygromyxa salina]
MAALFASFELDDVTEATARVSGLLIGRSRAELGLLERVLATLVAELGRRGASAGSDLR